MDYTKISTNSKVIELIKQKEQLEELIRTLDPKALIKLYELKKLNSEWCICDEPEFNGDYMNARCKKCGGQME